MTDGTSQGLFIVVAIVIFGIFVVLAYILFEDTLSPAMASMFTNATEETQKRLKRSYSLFDWESDLNSGMLEEILEGRVDTVVEIDDSTLYQGNTAVKVYFNGEGGTHSHGNDLVLWMNDSFNYALGEYSQVTVTYSAKSDVPTNFDFRLGGIFYSRTMDFDKLIVTNNRLDTEWNTYSVKLPSSVIVNSNSKPALVFWTDTEANVWISDLKVGVSRE